MKDITVVILTKNEEKNIRKCVESFRGIIKRFVIVDSFSTDKTEEICKQLNSELGKIGSSLDFYQNPWTTYAVQFNWGLNNTEINTEWVMRMDADEELTGELVSEIDSKLDSIGQDVNGIVVRRRIYFMGKWLKHGGRYPEKLLRIFRNGTGKCEERLMDEHLLIEGATVEFNNDLIDNNQKSLDWWISKHNWYSNREVADHLRVIDSLSSDTNLNKQAKRKRIIKDNYYYSMPKFFRAHLYFFYRYYIRLGFLDGTEGKIFTFLQAYWYRFLVDAKLYEYENNGNHLENQGDLKA